MASPSADRPLKPQFTGLLGVGLLGLFLVLVLFWIFSGGAAGPTASLRIVSGSENRALQPIVEAWAEDENVAVEIVYLGSVDIARELEKGRNGAYDVVWPASALWIDLGDQDKIVKHSESILRSPVVLALKKPIAESLGWTGRDVGLAEIRNAASAGRFRLAMTSATQSNSGASAYFGFLHALAGGDEPLTMDDLNREDVLGGVRDLLAAVDRSSGSSGWLKDAFVGAPDRFDAMINYEALAIEANRALVRAGDEPLYLVYPRDALAVADSPLGYVDKGDSAEDDAKEAAFLKLKAHLLSEPVQDRLVALGRRAGLIGLDVAGADPAVWNKDWGVDLARPIAPIPRPTGAVIRRALELYQTELRKPSFTIWVLDVSGSMDADGGAPIRALKQAMGLLLDPKKASVSLLQPSARDTTIVIAFNSRVKAEWRVDGAEPRRLSALLTDVNGLSPGGGTDLYLALLRAMEILDAEAGDGDLFERLPAIVAMTDGASDTGNLDAFRRAFARYPWARDVPMHAIAFGQADERQLAELTELSIGRLFDAKGDLADALRKAKGYN